MPRLFRYKGQAQHERPYLLLTTHYSLLTTHYSPLTYQAQHERPYVGIIAQELPEELAPYCRFRSRLAAAEHAALQTGSQERGPTQQSDALQIATERQPAEELPAAAGLFSSAHSQGVQLGPVDDDSPPGEQPPPAETAWLFLVDLSALQFVLLHTAKGLQQQAPSGAATAAPRPRRSTHPSTFPSQRTAATARHAPSPRASPTPPPLSLAAGAEAAARHRDTASVTRPARPRAPGEPAGRGDGGRALVTCAAAAHQLRRPPALARLHGPPRAGSCSSRSCSSSSVNLLHYYSTTVVPNLL